MNAISGIKKGLSTLKARRKELFWAWIAYQSIKGLITLSLIWIPLFLIWWHNR